MRLLILFLQIIKQSKNIVCIPFKQPLVDWNGKKQLVFYYFIWIIFHRFKFLNDSTTILFSNFLDIFDAFILIARIIGDMF